MNGFKEQTMALTTNYKSLAAKAPGRKSLSVSQQIRREHQRTAAWTPEPEPGRPSRPYIESRLHLPAGTKRYYLSVPSGRRTFKQAFDAGCRFDHSIGRWYIDNPVVLSDFTAWKPSLVQAK